MIFIVLLVVSTLAQVFHIENNSEVSVKYKKDNQIAYVSDKECPLLYIFDPSDEKWSMFCKYSQRLNIEESTLLRSNVQSDDAMNLSKQSRYADYMCTIDSIQFSTEGTGNCCCNVQTFDTVLSTEGLVAVIVVPIVFFIGGAIMYKLNSHNSPQAWSQIFEQTQMKA